MKTALKKSMTCLSFFYIFICSQYVFANGSASNEPVFFPSEHPLKNDHLTNANFRISLRRFQTDSIPIISKNSIIKPYDSSRTFKTETKSASYLHSLGKIGAIHTFSLLFLFSSSKEITNWEFEFGPELLRNAGKNLHKAWTRLPTLDNDPFITNYLHHPYAGSFYYNLVRNRGVSVLGSFEYAIIGSTIFEFITEAMFERPSIQDLISTPVIGSLLGEAIHQLTMHMSQNGFNFFEKIMVLITNPAYVFNHGFRVPSIQRKKELQEIRRKKNENVFKPV